MMTPEQFRSFPQNLMQLRALLESPVLNEAIAIVLNDVRLKNRVEPSSPEIVSVRTLSYRTGIEDFPAKLLELTEPIVPIRQDSPDSTFGEDEAFRKLNDLQTQHPAK